MRQSTLKIALVLCIAALATLATRSALAHDTGDRAHRIGVVDSLMLVERMLDEPEYADARTAVEQNWTQQLSLLEAEVNDLLTRRNAAVAGSLEQQEINQQGAQAQQRYQQLRQQGAGELEVLGTEQAREAYTKIAEASKVVADRLGYDFVVASRDSAEPTNANTVAGLAQQMLARPLIVYPDGHDITADVRTELGLTVAPAEDDAAE